MVREKLNSEIAGKITARLPDISEARTLTLYFQPDLISMNHPVGSAIPIAAVCLQDTTSTLEEVRYALFESLAHTTWYREIREPVSETGAVFFGKFYLDDAALRLYSAGEHLAKAIITMLEIKGDDLKPYRKTNMPHEQGSVQSSVGKYLLKEKPDHSLTDEVRKLERFSNQCSL